MELSAMLHSVRKCREDGIGYVESGTQHLSRVERVISEVGKQMKRIVSC